MSAAALPAKPASSAPHARPRPTGPTIVRWTGTALIGAWAAFWMWFAASVAVSEGGQSWLYGGGIVLGCLVVALAAIRWPRVGGALAIAAGLFIAWFFNGAQAILLFACPPIVGGLLAVLGGWIVRKSV
jgi:hypothetical protein